VGDCGHSAAGHPPLLRRRNGKLERIESNGLLFGVLPDPEYPVRAMALEGGDCFLLYTDGVVEPENAAGESFGETRMEQVLRESQTMSAAELLAKLLAEVRNWQPASNDQQDDITLVAIDVA
jgi:phosphoserine phosphatase RsbU/P